MQAKSLCNMVLVSGQIGLDPASMLLITSTAPPQARQCLRNLEVCINVKRDLKYRQKRSTTKADLRPALALLAAASRLSAWRLCDI
jgi:hypothetical protein